MAYHRQQGVDTAIVRIFNTYGPRMRAHDGRAIPTFVRQALSGEPITVFGDGSQTRSFCYVDDLVDGILRLAESGEHLPVNIGNPEEFTLLELAEKVIALDRIRKSHRLRSAARERSQAAPARHHACRELLGWAPRTGLDDGLRMLLERSRRAELLGQDGGSVKRLLLILARRSCWSPWLPAAPPPTEARRARRRCCWA